MKYLLSLLLCLPLTSSAQLVEIAVSGGIIPYSKYEAADLPFRPWKLEKRSQKTYTAGGRIGLNFRTMQIGLGCDYQDITHKSDATGYSPANPVQISNIENHVASQFVAGYIFINRAFQAGGGYFYLGLCGGYGAANMSSYDIVDDNVNAPSLVEKTAKARGFLGGGQLGFVLPIAYRVGFSFELGLRYAELNSDYPKQGSTPTNYLYKNTLLYMPTTVGLRFQLGGGCGRY